MEKVIYANSLAMETTSRRDDRSSRIEIRASAIVLLDGIKSRGAGLLTFTQKYNTGRESFSVTVRQSQPLVLHIFCLRNCKRRCSRSEARRETGVTRCHAFRCFVPTKGIAFQKMRLSIPLFTYHLDTCGRSSMLRTRIDSKSLIGDETTSSIHDKHP